MNDNTGNTQEHLKSRTEYIDGTAEAIASFAAAKRLPYKTAGLRGERGG